MSKDNGMGLYWALLVVLAIVCGFIGYMAAPNAVVETVPGEDIPFEVPVQANLDKIAELEAELAAPTIVEPMILDFNIFLDQAILDVAAELDDEDEFLTCDGDEFDDDEITVSRIYDDWSYTQNDNDEYTVEFEAKYKFDDDKDLRACRETRAYSVFYEDGEDPEVELLV